MSKLTPDFEKEADEIIELLDKCGLNQRHHEVLSKILINTLSMAYNQGQIDRIKNAKKSLEEIQGDNKNG